MKKKKLVSVATATVISANMLPTGLIQTFAEEVKTEQEQVQAVENLQENLKVESRAQINEQAYRTLTVNANIEGNSKWGTIEGLNTTQTLTTKFKYIKVPIIGTTSWTITNRDEKIDFEIKSKSGYTVDLSKTGEGSNNINYIKRSDSRYTGTISSLATVNDENKNKDVEANINITYRRKNDAQDITLIISPEDEDKLISPENLYFDENNNAAIDNSSEHEFKLNVPEGQEAYVTLDGNEVNIIDNKFTVGAGELKVEFKEKVEQYDLDVLINGQGSIVLAGKTLNGNTTVQLNKGKDSKITDIKPGEGYRLESVVLDNNTLDANEDGSYTVVYNETNKNLEVNFAEKKEVKFELVEESKPYNGEKQTFKVKVLDENGNIIETVETEYDFKIDHLVNPPGINPGTYEVTAKFDGNKDYKSGEFKGSVTIYDNRKEVKFELVEDSKPYNGEVQTFEVNVLDENGNIIETVKASYERNLENITDTLGKDVGTYDVTAKFKGNKDYRPGEFKGTVKIYDHRKEVKLELVEESKVYNGEKQTFKVNVLDENGNIIDTVDATYNTFQDNILTHKTGIDAGTYKVTAKFEGNEEYQPATFTGTVEIAKCKPNVSVGNKKVTYNGSPIKSDVIITPQFGYIGIYTGIDAKLSLIAHIDLNLDGDLGSVISKLINSMEVSNVGEFKKIFEDETVKVLLDAAKIDVSAITNALKFLPDNMALAFGAPVNAGAYISTAVVIDKNAEVTTGTGSLLINKLSRTISFTQDSLASGAKIKRGQTYTHKVVIDRTEQEVELTYTGLTSTLKTYSSKEAPTQPGTYVVTAHLKADNNHRDAITARTFRITR